MDVKTLFSALNNKKALAILVAVLFSISLFIFWLAAQDLASCVATKKIDMSVVVDKKALSAIGLNADTDHLNFGKVSPLSDVQRSVRIMENSPSKVKVFLRGEVGKWVTVHNPDFSLLSQEPYEVTFTVSVPASAQEGKYSGEAIFCFLEE